MPASVGPESDRHPHQTQNLTVLIPRVAVTLLGMSIPNWAISNEERDAGNWLIDLRDHGAGDLLDDFGVEKGTDLGILTCVEQTW